MSIETEVAKTLGEINEVLKEVAKEKIDPSVYTQILQDFTEEKKQDLQKLVDQLDSDLGKLTKTFKTIDENLIIPDGYIYQEVYEKDGVITKYGGVFIAGYNNGFNGGASFQGAGFVRQPLPQDVEFDYIGGSVCMLYARPKAGQSDVGGVVGSLDNVLFMWGGGQFGTAGNGTTNNYYIPIYHKFNSRVKKIQAGAIERIYSQGYQNTLVLLENGEVWGCGSNWQAGLGLGNTAQTNTWTKNPNISSIKDIYMVRALVFAVGDEALYSWGENVYGSCGVGNSGVIRSPRIAKSISSTAKVRFSANGAYGGDTEYLNLAVCIDGKLFGAGFNGYGEINVDGVSKNTLVEINHPSGSQWVLKETDSFYMHMELSAILKENDDGNMELYVAGSGRYGYGDTASEGAYSKKGYKLIKLFEGNGWRLAYQRQYSDNANFVTRLFIVNEKKREIWAFGDNTRGGLGIGSNSNTLSRKVTKVILPQITKTAKRFEVRPTYYNASGSIALIIDDDFYACGTSNSSYMLKSGTTFIPQKQN